MSVPADDVPLHTGQMEEFLPELQSLINYFHLSYDAGKIKTTADEMELFSVVILSDGFYRKYTQINKSPAVFVPVIPVVRIIFAAV